LIYLSSGKDFFKLTLKKKSFVFERTGNLIIFDDSKCFIFSDCTLTELDVKKDYHNNNYQMLEAKKDFFFSVHERYLKQTYSVSSSLNDIFSPAKYYIKII
jgi:hypothetical protein